MAKDFINVDQSVATNKFGNDLLRACNQLAAAEATLGQLKDHMDHMVSAPDYADIGTYFGIGAGDEEATYNLVAGTIAELAADTNLQTLITRVG